MEILVTERYMFVTDLRHRYYTNSVGNSVNVFDLPEIERCETSHGCSHTISGSGKGSAIC